MLLTSSTSDNLLTFLANYLPLSDVEIKEGEKSQLTVEDGECFEGRNTIAYALCERFNPSLVSSDPQINANIHQWLSASSKITDKSVFLQLVNDQVQEKSFLADAKPTLADVAVYLQVYSMINMVLSKATFEKLFDWVLRIQESLPKDLLEKLNHKTFTKEDFLAESAKQSAAKDSKKAKAKNEKPKKGQPAKELIITPSLLDLRVGLISECQKHPDADSLYVEKIDLGESEPRTVVSGLVKHIPLEEMTNRKVVVLCNLKPASMRGIKSHAMVLAATSPEGKVEIIDAPADSTPGDKVNFGEFDGTPEPVLNPKKKIWETIQPNLFTNDQLNAYFLDPDTKKTHILSTKSGLCTVKTVVNATIK